MAERENHVSGNSDMCRPTLICQLCGAAKIKLFAKEAPQIQGAKQSQVNGCSIGKGVAAEFAEKPFPGASNAERAV